ncbi:MAG: PorT family protein [Saprospiraceae bacterium]|nr:PorT family protein [Saprospiraceae bacterium]
MTILQKYFLLLFLLLGSSAPLLQAQMADGGVRFGLKLGVNGSSLYDDAQAGDKKSETGIVGGGFAKIKLTKHFSLRPEVLFATRGGDYNYNNSGETKLKLNYLEVPLSLEYNLFAILNIHAGLHVGVLAGESGKFRDNQGNTLNFDLRKDDLNNFNYGWHVGGGIDLGNLGIHLRILRGLQEVSNSDSFNQLAGKLKNSAWELSVSYALK